MENKDRVSTIPMDHIRARKDCGLLSTLTGVPRGNKSEEKAMAKEKSQNRFTAVEQTSHAVRNGSYELTEFAKTVVYVDVELHTAESDPEIFFLTHLLPPRNSFPKEVLVRTE